MHLLTTNNEPLTRLFTAFNATSTASVLCARMAAQIAAVYPSLRPETARAVIVHSAEWTAAMRTKYLSDSSPPTKNEYTNLIRHCGWGEPDLERATLECKQIRSHSWSKTQCTRTKRKKNKSPASRDMNLHALPWSREVLEGLQHAPVQMRVTLSYFVEPNPSARGAASKFYYPCHRYPAAGWWRTHPALKRYDLPARYSLIVSIRTQQAEIDLYNAIARRVEITT